MMAILLGSFITSLFAQEPVHWNYLISVNEKHEFYENNQPIQKPKNSWQVLFSVGYLNKNFSSAKDCVLYKIPGDESGVLKIKTIKSEESCDNYLFQPGDIEIKNIRSLQFNHGLSFLTINYSLDNFKNGKLEAKFQSDFVKPEAKIGISSVEFKSPKMIMLAPIKNQTASPLGASLLADRELCHNIDEDCNEQAPSSCLQCKNGWYEIPNGCAQGPKYCGYVECGKKDGHACRRGYKWQRKESVFDCRIDNSFAYCSKGLKVVCEGKKAFCR